MMPEDLREALDGALRLSRALLEAADRGDAALVARLDAERLGLLTSLRRQSGQMDAGGRSMLREIAVLNDQALGRMEHRRRAIERDMDMLSAGRRAVNAYASTGSRR